MAEVNVSFCSPVDMHGELCEELQNLLAVYHESEPVEEAQFQRPDDAEGDTCTALHIDVEEPFREQLRDDIAATIREHHDCDVVVGEYDEADEPDFVHGSCQVE